MMSDWIRAAAFGLLLTVMTADADEPATPPEKPTAAGGETAGSESAKPDNPEAKPSEAEGDKPPTLLDKLSRELFKEIDDGSARPEEKKGENKLDRAAQGMRNAGNQLDEKATGKETRAIQEQVIRDLDELIRQMQNPPPPNGGGGGGGGGGGASSRGGGASSRGGASGQTGRQTSVRGSQQGGQTGQGQDSSQAQAGSEGGSSKSGGKEKSQAEGSEERTEQERKAAEEAARKKKMEMDVWGHLPPHLREQLLNTYGERMLPKYQQLVIQFYEALSDQGTTNRR